MATVQDEFNKFLCYANLLMFKDSFISEGVERVYDVMDLSDDTLTGFGLTKTQINRLRRMFQKWQLENQPQPKEQRIAPKAGEVEGKINTLGIFSRETSSSFCRNFFLVARNFFGHW